MHVFVKKSLCLSSACEDEYFIRAGKYFDGLTKDALLFMSGFIQAEPTGVWCDNEVIATVTLRKMYVSILPPCGC